MSKSSTTETKPATTPAEAPVPFGADRNIRVGAPFLAAAALFVSRDKTRPYLGGVYIELAKGGGPLLVATDGHRLIALRDPDGVCEKPFICAVPGVLRKFINEKNVGHVHFVGHQAQVTTSWGTLSDIVTAPPVDDEYPDWRNSIPAQKTTRPVTFFNVNGAYIGDFARAAQIMNGGTIAGLTITSVGKEKSPLLVTAETCNGPLFGLQMPVAIEGGDRPASIPDWIMK